MLTCALCLALTSSFPAHADPEPTEEGLRSKVDKLTTRVEILTEKYNGRRLELKDAKKAAEQAEYRANQTATRLEKVSDLLGELAATRYMGGGMQKPLALMTAENPQSFMDRATLLRHLSRQQAARWTDVRAASERAERAEKEAEQAADKVRGITRDLRKKKSHIEDLVAEAEDKLAEIEAEAGAGHTPVPVGDYGPGTAARAVEIALAQQGDPYVWAAAGPDAFDCSGLIVYAYGQLGIGLPHYTGALWEAGPHVSQSELRPGDLVWTSSHHVGIYVGNGQMVHAPNSGDVVSVDDIWSFYGAVRIV